MVRVAHSFYRFAKCKCFFFFFFREIVIRGRGKVQNIFLLGNRDGIGTERGSIRHVANIEWIAMVAVDDPWVSVIKA
jgi:hypothetical protein